MSKPLRATEVQVYRPYPDEVPWELLADAGVDEARLREVLARNLLRVGKHAGRVVGSYALRREDPVRFELVALIVADGFRRKGVGRWLLGHAIGLAETKGGREVFTRAPATGGAARFLGAAGFRPNDDGTLRLLLTPE